MDSLDEGSDQNDRRHHLEAVIPGESAAGTYDPPEQRSWQKNESTELSKQLRNEVPWEPLAAQGRHPASSDPSETAIRQTGSLPQGHRHGPLLRTRRAAIQKHEVLPGRRGWERSHQLSPEG